MLEKRSTESEILEKTDHDRPLLEGGYRWMRVFNRLMGGIHVVRRFVQNQASIKKSSRPLRILDIGSGSCDIPLSVSRWAKLNGIRTEFTCIERNPVAVDLCREHIDQDNDPGVKIVQADIFSYEPSEPFDCATASMFFHHFTDEEIITLLTRFKKFIRQDLLISDLLRHVPFYLASIVITATLPAATRHDARVSVARGFKLTELRHLVKKVEGLDVTVSRDMFFRALAVVHFNPSP